MRIYILWLLFFVGITTNSQNCNNTLSGNLIDFHDNTALAGATLVLVETQQIIQTNFDGNYTISNLCNQNYTIKVSHPYCSTKTYTVKISGDTKKTFRLEHHLEELNEVMVKGKAYSNKSRSITGNTISRKKIEQFSSGTLGDALNSLSGVSSLNTGNTVVKPIINGLHSSRVVIINNGVRMEDQEWGAEHAPNVDMNTVGNITLIKGAGALQYSGDAVGGIIVAEATKAPIKDSLYGKTILSGASNGRGSSLTSLLTKSYDNGWYGAAQGTIKLFGDFEAPNYILSNTGVSERNASLRIGLNRFNYGLEAYYSLFKNEIGILRASHLGGAQDLVRAIGNTRPLIINDFTYSIDAPKQDVTHHLARLKIFKNFNHLGKLSFQYDFQKNNRLEFDIRRGSDRDKASLDLELTTHTLMLDLNSKLSESTHLKTGVSAKYQNNIPNPKTGVRRLIPDYDKYNLGAYAVSDFSVNDKLILEIGGRFDYTFIDAFKFYKTSFWESRNYDQRFPEIIVEELVDQISTNPEFQFYNASATAGGHYSISKNSKLFFNYSLASRAPNPSELFSEGLHHSASRIELGDLSFNSELAHKFTLTLKHSHDNFSFSINPYINTINDFIIIEPIEIQKTVRGSFQVWEYRQTNAQLLGFDFDASYTFLKNLKLNHQFSLVKGYDLSRNEPLISMPPANTKNEIIYNNPKLNNLKIALQSEYVFRQNEFPNNNFEVFIPETQTNENVDISTPPDAYHLLNFKSSLDINVNRKSILTLGLSVTNLLNTSYRNYLNLLRLYADDLGRNIQLNLKINY